MFNWLWQAADAIQGAPVERRLAEMIAAERIKNDPFPDLVTGERFQPGGCYFGIRLAGLHVVDARQFTSKRYPLCVSLAEFKQRGKDRAVPFSIGPDEMVKRLTSAGVFGDHEGRPGWIELRDLTIVKPTPAGLGNLSLFVGLYSVPGDDIVKTLLDVVGNLSQTAGVAASLPLAGPTLDVAKAVYSGFGTLIGLKSLQPLAQAQNGRALPETGSGYLVVGNTRPGTVEAENLTVAGGKLCRGTKLVTDFDYCLVAIERHASILEDATNTAPDLFDEGWQEVVRAFDGDDAGAPPRALRKLVGAVRGSPDLIEADRAAVMAGYFALYKTEKLVRDRFTDVTRGEGRSLEGAISAEIEREENSGRATVSSQLSTIYDAIARAEQPSPAGLDFGMGGRDAPPVQAPIVQAAIAMRDKLGKGKKIGNDGDLADALLRAASG